MLLALTLFASQGFAESKTVDLGAAYTPTWGDHLASQLNDVLPMALEANDYEIGYLLVFDPDAGRLKVLLYGSRTTIDDAKESMEKFMVAWKGALDLIDRSHGVAIGSDQYEIHYVNKAKGTKLIVYLDGEYKLP